MVVDFEIVRDGKIYDTKKASFLFSNEIVEHSYSDSEHLKVLFYKTEKGTYFCLKLRKKLWSREYDSNVYLLSDLAEELLEKGLLIRGFDPASAKQGGFIFFIADLENFAHQACQLRFSKLREALKRAQTNKAMLHLVDLAFDQAVAYHGRGAKGAIRLDERLSVAEGLAKKGISPVAIAAAILFARIAF